MENLWRRKHNRAKQQHKSVGNLISITNEKTIFIDEILKCFLKDKASLIKLLKNVFNI